MRDRSQHRELPPLLFSNSVWVILRPTELTENRLLPLSVKCEVEEEGVGDKGGLVKKSR